MEYETSQVGSVLRGLGIYATDTTNTVFLGLCPFHDNRRTPAFAVNKRNGTWICFNESCAKSGSLEHLVMFMTNRTQQEAARFIESHQSPEGVNILERINSIFDEDPEKWNMFPQQVVDNMVENMWSLPQGREYLHGRGIFDEAIRFFEIGLSTNRGDVVAVPVHTPDGALCVGVVGRGIHEKKFDNSKGLPRNRIVFNLHRARKASREFVIIVESSLDAIKIHQAGFPNVVAFLGSHVSDTQIALLERNFDRVMIMSDNDDAGYTMREKLVDKLSITCLHAATEYGTLYPEAGTDGRPPKDAGDLSDDQIGKLIENAITTAEWKLSA